jgi:diguanylate cyclase (GGDEF)-like protein/PAS domain S-box-containing protein
MTFDREHTDVTMPLPLRILLVEASEVDSVLIQKRLKDAAFELDLVRVETASALRRELDDGTWDVVLSDYELPGFSGFDALRLVRGHDSDLPFVLVAGAISEERVAALLRDGANDYVLKDNLVRLVPVVMHAMREAAVRRERRVAEEALARSEELYRVVVDGSLDGIAIHSMDDTIVFANQRAAQILGYASADLIIGTSSSSHVPPDSRAHVAGITRRLVETGIGMLTEIVLVRADGARITIESSRNLIRDQRGAPTGIVAIFRDVTERKWAEQALRQSEERYRTVVETSLDGITVLDRHGVVKFANARMLLLLGLESQDAIVGRPGRDFVAPDDQGRIAREFAAVFHQGYVSDVRCRLVRADGTTVPVEISGRVTTDETGCATGLITTNHDVSTQIASEEQLRHLALHDALTDLPNRTLLIDRLQLALAAAHRNAQQIALLLMDLDGFKEINDTYGHQHGDTVLQEVARRLCATLRQSDTVARLGGDEFAMILPDVDQLGALEAASKLAAALEPPIDLADQRFHVGASVGIALAPEHGDNADQLLRLADVAMYAAKRSNSGHAIYSATHDPFSPLRLVLINELREAIETDGLVLSFQPKLHLATGLIEGVEALVRWQHPTHGLIPPDQFIGLAEHSGLIRPLTAWVVHNALLWCARWRDRGFDLSVAVNLSARGLHDPDLPIALCRSLTQTGVPPNRLTAEITESSIMAEPERAMEVLSRIKDLGVRVSIDDFGTGYSSLSYLRDLRADELKIDKSFVLELHTNAGDAFIVRAIIDLGRSLGLEGVESQELLDMLGVLSSDWVQGYHIGRPQPGESLIEWLDTRPDVRRCASEGTPSR